MHTASDPADPTNILWVTHDNQWFEEKGALGIDKGSKLVFSAIQQSSIAVSMYDQSVRWVNKWYYVICDAQ